MTEVQAFLNGEYMPLSECRISPLDRGFVFGDGIYELLPVYKSKAFRLAQHLTRLQRSLQEIRIQNPYSLPEWEDLIRSLIEKSPDSDLAVYIQVSRGVAPRDHVFPANNSPTVFAMANPMPVVPELQLQNGVSLITVDDQRWQRCDIKVTSLLANILAKQDAAQASAVEAVMIRDGYALEGSASNLFIVRQGVVYTHPKDNLILPGVTRDFILELLDELNIEYIQQEIPKEWLFTSDEVWITSSTKEVLAVANIDGRMIADGKPGALWGKTYDLYQQYKIN